MPLTRQTYSERHALHLQDELQRYRHVRRFSDQIAMGGARAGSDGISTSSSEPRVSGAAACREARRRLARNSYCSGESRRNSGSCSSHVKKMPLYFWALILSRWPPPSVLLNWVASTVNADASIATAIS